MKVRMVPLNVQIPEEAKEFYDGEANRRMISTAAVVREVLVNHAGRKRTDRTKQLIGAK